MKKLLAILLVAAFAAAAAFAQDGEKSIKFSGDVKTGIYYSDEQYAGDKLDVKSLEVANHDGDPNGNRFRLNMDYDNGNNIGFRARLEWTNWTNAPDTTWAYAFGYGNFFNDTLAQMTISVGKLGGSPWGTGGPEMWKELESSNYGGGMRVEWKPAWPEEWGKLNVGFVLNYFNSDRDQGIPKETKVTLAQILEESVIGVSYTHDWFMVRGAYRFDSFYDALQNNKGDNIGVGEDEVIYRVEEYALRRWVPGLRVWGLGHLFGLSALNKEIKTTKNWFFIEYDPPELGPLVTPFTAQLNLGNESANSPRGDIMGDFFLKPSFFWHFSPGGYSKLISIGSAFRIAFDYGAGGIEAPHPYSYIEIEPKIQLNFQSAYIAFAYQFRKQYLHSGRLLNDGTQQALEGHYIYGDPYMQSQWMNLRFCINF